MLDINPDEIEVVVFKNKKYGIRLNDSADNFMFFWGYPSNSSGRWMTRAGSYQWDDFGTCVSKMNEIRSSYICDKDMGDVVYV